MKIVLVDANCDDEKLHIIAILKHARINVIDVLDPEDYIEVPMTVCRHISDLVYDRRFADAYSIAMECDQIDDLVNSIRDQDLESEACGAVDGLYKYFREGGLYD